MVQSFNALTYPPKADKSNFFNTKQFTPNKYYLIFAQNKNADE
jgi:hypothetical protein